MKVECCTLNRTFTPSLEDSRNLQKREWKECKSQVIGRRDGKCYLRGMTQPLQTRTHSSRFCLHLLWTRPRLSLTPHELRGAVAPCLSLLNFWLLMPSLGTGSHCFQVCIQWMRLTSSNGQFRIHGPTDHPANKVNYRKQKITNMGKKPSGRWRDDKRRREIKMGADWQ